jgi:hypothetical protein
MLHALTTQAIPVLSLAIALLAVFVGPFVSWLITKRQIESAQRLANKQIAAPLQIAWANELRKLLAEFCTTGWLITRHPHPDVVRAESTRLMQVGHEIIVMLNPNQKSHSLLMKAIDETAYALKDTKQDSERHSNATKQLMGLAQAVIQEEYVRVRADA